MEKSECAFCVAEKILGQAFCKLCARKGATTQLYRFHCYCPDSMGVGVRKASKGAFIMQHFKIVISCCFKVRDEHWHRKEEIFQFLQILCFFCVLVSLEWTKIGFFLPYSVRKALIPRLDYFYPPFPTKGNFLRDLMLAAGRAENSVFEVLFKSYLRW